MVWKKNFDIKGKRNQDGIIRDILKFLFFHNGINQTEIMYRANLSHTQQVGYFNKLEELGYIILQVRLDNNRRQVFLTEAGTEALFKLLLAQVLERGILQNGK